MYSNNETSEDLLGFKVHTDLLIDVNKDDSVLPITRHFFGDWGSERSSILRIIQEEFEESNDYETLYNNTCQICGTKLALGSTSFIQKYII